MANVPAPFDSIFDDSETACVPWTFGAAWTPSTTENVQFKRWTGSEWEDQALQVFVEDSWTTKPLKRWTGSEWVEVVCL